MTLKTIITKTDRDKLERIDMNFFFCYDGVPVDLLFYFVMGGGI